MMSGKLTEQGGKARRWFLDLIYPNYCIGCGKLGKLVCDYCLQHISDGRIMVEPGLDALWVVASYNDVVIQKAVGLFKYKYIVELKFFFNVLFVNFFKKFKIDLNEVVLVPIPLYSKKKRKRGFNQSELLANIASEINDWPIRNILIRQRSTNSQASLNKTDRRGNVSGAFGIRPNDLDRNNSVIVLVDDVYTTGATMGECVKVLKDSGFQKIIGLVLARKLVN